MNYKVKEIEEAFELIKELKICTIFENKKVSLPSLWQHVDIPDKQDGEKGWGQRVITLWDWKNRLPALYPNEIFYGKINGGVAVLMSIEYLHDTHFPSAYREVTSLNSVAQFIYDMIRNEPWETAPLRNMVMDECNCSKSQFDTALKKLQITMNVVRSNDPEIERDTWLIFSELYPEIWNKYIKDE